MTASAGRGLKDLVHAALPTGARPTATCSQPLHRHVIEQSPDDVVELTRQQVAAEFGTEAHVVICLRATDLDPAQDGDVLRVLERTDGGVLVFGVAYVQGDAP